MKIGTPLAGLSIGASLLATLPLEASAQDPIVAGIINATTYLNGGIGREEEAAMRRMAGDYPLRMTFSERKDGEFLAGVPVVIVDGHGKQVFELSKAGPMLFVKLPNGKYKVSARFKGLTESQEVTLARKDGKNGKDLYFHWKGKQKA